ncbi:hypothetical protein C8R45DRAFT_1140125 [Mycena sanguinolenta]|nr:hypothetical protein C8R45DRAFT_1140125 [Mycena sanguinolenta]
MALKLTTTCAAFFGAAIGSFLYGLFFILTILSTALHIQRMSRTQGPLNAPRGMILRRILLNPMLVGGFTMFLTVTAHWVLDMVDTAYGVLESDDPDVYFLAPDKLPFKKEVVELAFPRCIVFGLFGANLRWLQLPPLSIIGKLVCGIGIIHQMTVTQLGDSMFSNPLRQWIVADGVLALVTNIYSPLMISYRIHTIRSNPAPAAHGREDLKSIIAILIESAALLRQIFSFLCAATVFSMITYATKSPLDGYNRATLGTVSGLSFMLINVRVALGWSQTRQARQTAPGSSIVMACPPTTIRMDTCVESHVDIQKNKTDEAYELA